MSLMYPNIDPDDLDSQDQLIKLACLRFKIGANIVSPGIEDEDRLYSSVQYLRRLVELIDDFDFSGGGGGPPAAQNLFAYYLISWDTEPVLNTSLAGGDVFDYVLGGVTRYRFIPNAPYDPTLDTFYETFSGGILSDPIVSRDTEV